MSFICAQEEQSRLQKWVHACTELWNNEWPETVKPQMIAEVTEVRFWICLVSRMHADVQAYKWQSGLSPEEVIFRREKMTAANSCSTKDSESVILNNLDCEFR